MTDVQILVVDDNQDLADGLAMILEDDGHQVEIAYDGATVLRLTESQRFDMAFLDVKLPDANGLDLLRQIRKTQPDLRGYLMTGFRVEQLMGELIESGRVVVLRAPFGADDFELSRDEAGPQGLVIVVGGPEDEDPIHKWPIAGIDLMPRLTDPTQIPALVDRAPPTILFDLGRPLLRSVDALMDLKEQGYQGGGIVVLRRAPGESNAEVLRSQASTGCLFKPFDPEMVIDAVSGRLG